jgi:hypothetical protein
VPKPYPREFRDDVVRVARSREPGTPVEEIAKHSGAIRCPFKRLRQTEIDERATAV